MGYNINSTGCQSAAGGAIYLDKIGEPDLPAYQRRRCRIDRQPLVVLYVCGRKMFAQYSPAIRAMWRVGKYQS